MIVLENHQFTTPNEIIQLGNINGSEILSERLKENFLIMLARVLLKFYNPETSMQKNDL